MEAEVCECRRAFKEQPRYILARRLSSTRKAIGLTCVRRYGLQLNMRQLALTTKFLGVSEPKGIPWREFVREAFERAGLSRDEASYWASYFIDVRRSLHGDCFYGLYYEESEHKPLIERAPQHVSLVAGLVKQGSTP